MNFVPAEFFRQFLADLGKPTVYSVKDTSHWWAQSYIPYKYETDFFQDV